MPDYNPSEWNSAESQGCNNCYNYATDNRNKQEPGKKPPDHARPGRKGGKEIRKRTGSKPVGTTPDGKTISEILFDYSCEDLIAGCIADGLSRPDADGKCGENCWKIAAYVRRATDTETGTYHFLRQDSDGSWSHKPGTNRATQNQYDAAKDDYSGPKITDPTRDPVGKGLEFCGFLCCCQGQKVAFAPPSGRDAQILVADATALETLRVANRGSVERWVERLIAGTRMDSRAGYGPGLWEYKIALGRKRVLISKRSISLWDGRRVRRWPDRRGSAFAAFGRLSKTAPSGGRK